MGTYSKSNFGSISGKVGEGVGSKWRGIKYLRSLPEKSSKAASTKQLEVQAKLALSAEMLSPIKNVLNLGFGDKNLSGKSGYNVAVKNFHANCILGNYPNLTVDYARMLLSKGALEPLRAPTIGYNGKLQLSWISVLNKQSAFFDDEVLAVVYNQSKGLYLLDDTAMRNDSLVEIEIGASSGDIIHLWVFCVIRGGTEVSKSQYVGTITI
ncbi:MAG: DUF6266 family protein [Pedobacter sp.]|nr:DUF6266 family protein [Pedobacter sp.]